MIQDGKNICTGTEARAIAGSDNSRQEKLDELEKSAPVVPQDINHAVEQRYEDHDFVANARDLGQDKTTAKV